MFSAEIPLFTVEIPSAEEYARASYVNQSVDEQLLEPKRHHPKTQALEMV
jgi:hypothetical protein